MGRGRPRKRRLRSRGDDDDEAEREEEYEEEERDDDPAPLFPVGAEVEVRSDDPGFAASYYEATVEGYNHSGLGGYVVAYSTLSRRDGGDSPLREVVAAAANVRPRPPHRPPPRRGFAVHDMVDAFHSAGWWTGIVVSAVPVPVPVPEADTAQRPRCRRLYKVSFPTSRELLDFPETALRPSRVFLDDCWLPAAATNAKNVTPLFREGSQVEVSGSTKTFGKYWTPATVLKVIGASSFLVQYRDDDAKEDGELATEILDSQYIRPTRDMLHMDSKYRFAPSSPAEVFREGSWWPGVILEVLDIESTKKYVVKIKSHEADNVDDVECTTDLLTVDHTQLRPRYDWSHGKWVRSISEKPVNKGSQSTSRKRPASAVMAMASCNDRVDIASMAPCTDNDSISYESGSHLMENVNKDVVSEPFGPDLVSNENDPTSTKHKKPVNRGPQSTSRKRPASAVLAMTSCNDRVDIASMATCTVNDSISYESGSHLMEKVNKDVVSEPFWPDLVPNENDPTKHKASTCPEKVVKQQGAILSFKSDLPTKPTKRKTAGSYLEKVVKQQGRMLSFESHLALPSRSSATGFGNFKYDAKLYPSGQLERPTSQMVANHRPSAPQTGQLQASLFGSFGTLRPLPLPQTQSFIIPSHTIEFGSVVGSDKALPYQENQSTDDGMAGVKQSTNFGSFSAFKNFAGYEEHGMPKQDHISVMMRYAAEGSQSMENSEITQVSSIGTSNDSTEAQPPGDTVIAPKGAMVMYAAEGMENSEITQVCCISTSNDSTEAQPGDTVIAPPKGSEGTPMSKFVPSRSLLKRSRSDNVQEKESMIAERPSEIPFVKTSPLWAQIEAMEVFRKVPQRPNFDKYQQHVPEVREGMALGLMLSFANLAESVNRLCIEDEDAVFEDKMKGVSFLEADGFDVEHLRSRLEMLLRIKKGRAELQVTIKDLERRFCDEEARTRRRAQMSVLNMSVRQLELQACVFRGMMQSAISQEISDASEISRLKTQVSELEQRFSSVTGEW